MEYVYAAMLLHSAKKEISEDSVAGVLKAAHVEADSSRVKALVASLKEVNIDEAISKAAVAVAAPVQAAAPVEGAHKKEEKKEEQKSMEEAAEGLAGLFG